MSFIHYRFVLIYKEKFLLPVSCAPGWLKVDPPVVVLIVLGCITTLVLVLFMSVLWKKT